MTTNKGEQVSNDAESFLLKFYGKERLRDVAFEMDTTFNFPKILAMMEAYKNTTNPVSIQQDKGCWNEVGRMFNGGVSFEMYAPLFKKLTDKFNISFKTISVPVLPENKIKRLPNENDFQFELRQKKYNQALNCDCKRCKEIIEEYNQGQGQAVLPISDEEVKTDKGWSPKDCHYKWKRIFEVQKILTTLEKEELLNDILDIKTSK